MKGREYAWIMGTVVGMVCMYVSLASIYKLLAFCASFSII